LSLYYYSFVFFHDTPTTVIYTLSLHDALPISVDRRCRRHRPVAGRAQVYPRAGLGRGCPRRGRVLRAPASLPERCPAAHRSGRRSEEHTSELQSRFDLVCRLLLEKKKKKKTTI